MKKLVNLIVVVVGMVIMFSCSSDDNTVPVIDERSFTTESNTDFFINRDGTVDITVTGEYKDLTNIGDIKSRGFVYGTSSKTEVSATNTISLRGANPVTGVFEKLPKGKTYYVRGYFEMEDGSYFYGNEVQFSTDVDASTTRTLKMEMKPEPFFISSTEMTPHLDVKEITKESPIEIGFEYSLNSDFSDSTIVLDTRSGNVWLTFYQVVVSNLTASTTYHFRPYAKYEDGTVTNGGTSKQSYTTSDPVVFSVK